MSTSPDQTDMPNKARKIFFVQEETNTLLLSVEQTVIMPVLCKALYCRCTCRCQVKNLTTGTTTYMYWSLKLLWYPIVTDLCPSLSGVHNLASDQNFSNTLHLLITQFRILSLYLGTLAVLLRRLMSPCLSSPKYCWIKTCEIEKQQNIHQAIWIYSCMINME